MGNKRITPGDLAQSATPSSAGHLMSEAADNVRQQVADVLAHTSSMSTDEPSSDEIMELVELLNTGHNCLIAALDAVDDAVD